MRIEEKTFNKWFNVFILGGMALAVIITTILMFEGTQAAKTLLLVSSLGSIFGILSTVTSANGKIWTFFFGFFDVTIYAVICFISAKYANALQHALYFVPMQIIGYMQWRKRGNNENKEVKARRLDSKQRIWSMLFFVAASIIAYLILQNFGGQEASKILTIILIMDVVSMVCNILGQFLMSTAYMEQWIFWIGVNIASILMWVFTINSGDDSYAIIYIIKYSFYLLNSFNGLRIWLRLSRD